MLKVGDLTQTQEQTLAMMRKNRGPWCLHKATAAALLRRGLVVQSGVCCKKHNDPMYVLAHGKDHVK